MQNNEDEYIGSSDLDDVSKYELPEAKEIVLDLKNNKTLDTSELSPIELIYLTAKEKNIPIKKFEIKNGLIDSGCRKPNCWGRGFKGYSDNGKIPIPCSCLFEKSKEENNSVSINRKNVRMYERALQKDGQKQKEKAMKELGLKALGNGVYGKIKKGTSELLKYEWKQFEKKWNFSRIKEVISEVEVLD